MRVGLFTESYDPIINGVSTSVKTLAAELIRAGHTPVVVAPQYPGLMLAGPRLPAFVEDGEAGFEIIRVPAWRTVFNPDNPFAFPPIGPQSSALRALKLDVVHTQQPFGIGMHGRVTAQRLGVPLISTFHTLYTEYTHYFRVIPKSTSHQILAMVMRSYYASCTAIIVPSRAAGLHLGGLGVPSERLHVIPTGVAEAPVVIPAAVKRMGRTFSLPPGVPVLLFVGRMAREKNLDLLIDAFARLGTAPLGKKGGKDEHPILLLVGSGPYLDACRQQVKRLGLEPWVRFAGFLKRSELAPVYAAATVFCFPSTTETQGVVLSEAQSHGLPCVVVDGGGAPEFIRPDIDALLVPNRSDAFAAAIHSLLSDGDRRRSFAAAALASPLRPTPKAMSEQVIALYREVLSTHRTIVPTPREAQGG